MIERHVEKIVLAVCILIFGYAMFHWAFSSPLEIEVVSDLQGRKTAVAPGEVDAILLDTARRLEAQMQQGKASLPPVPDYAKKLQRLQADPLPPMGPLVEVTSPSIQLKMDETSQTGPKMELKDLLAAIPKPGKPSVMVDREFTQKGDEPEDVLAAHVAGIYPWAELTNRWSNILAETSIPPDIFVVAVEAEIRERRFDGAWGPARVVMMARVPQVDPDGTRIPLPALPDFDGENVEEVHAVIRDLAENWQEEILEPTYWNIWWATREWGTWMIHLPSNPVSEKLAKLLEPDEEERPSRRPPVRRVAPNPRGSARGSMDRYGAGPRGGFETRGSDMRRRGSARGDMFGSARGGISARNPRGRTRLPQVTARRTATEISAPKVTPVPPMQDQRQDGNVLFWFHDTGIEGLKVYQYRCRLVLVNPLVTFIGYVKDPEDAKLTVIRTPFSEWSDPVSVPQATEFFVASAIEFNRQVYVEIFARGRGQWVMKRFQLAEGELIGAKATVKFTNPDDGTRQSKPMDFSTGAVAVRFDFKKKIQRRNVAVGTVEMVYLDAKGQLKTRIGLTDKNSPRYKQLKEETQRAKAATEAAAALGN